MTTFFYPPVRKERTTLLPSILRPEILSAKSEPGEHLLVYQTSTTNTQLPEILKQSGLPCHIYGLRRDLTEDVRDGNLLYRPFSEKGFIDDLRTARAVIAGGGYTLMSEAVYLHKPMLSLPVKGQFEQVLNALYLEKLGYGMYAPALAAVLMRLFVSKEGLRRALGPLPSLKIGLAAVLLPLALVLILVATVTMINIGEPTPGKPMGSLLAILTFVGVPIGTLLAFGEEFGWRGYLLPQLLPLGEVKAALIVGLIWGPWHLPVLIVGLNYPGQPIIAVLAVFLLSATLLSFLHTRFYVASGYSLIAVALLHGSLNTFSDRLTDAEHLSGNPLIVSAGGVIASVLLAVGIFITYRVLARRTSS